MKIAVESTVLLKGHSKKNLEKIGKIARYKWGCSREDFFNAAKDCEIIISNKWFYNEMLPKLKAKLISLWSTGFDIIDLEKCREMGIIVTNVPAYSTNSVAEQAIALIMELTKKTGWLNRQLLDGKWAYELPLMTEIKGKTLGIIGFGAIGAKVAEIAKSMEMKILICSRKNRQKDFHQYKFTEIEELLKNSDFVTIHAPLNSQTRHLIDKKKLKMMKKSAFIVNCSRGAIINETDLIAALKNKIIAGAGLDVFEKEPLPMESGLRKLENVVMTPHNAFYTSEAVERLNAVCIGNIINYLNKKPTNVIN